MVEPTSDTGRLGEAAMKHVYFASLNGCDLAHRMVSLRNDESWEIVLIADRRILSRCDALAWRGGLPKRDSSMAAGASATDAFATKRALLVGHSIKS